LFLRIAKVVVALIDMGCSDPKREDFRGCKPVASAALKGPKEAVKIIPR